MTTPLRSDNADFRKATPRTGRDQLAPVGQALGQEVLQQSGMARYPWPDEDPQAVQQLQCKMDEDVHRLIESCVGEGWCDREQLLERASRMPKDQAVLHLLSHREFNFNSAPGVRNEALWRENIRRAVQAGEPIRLIYPLFCKIGNWAKQMTAVGVTAGEEAVIRHFKNLHNLVQQVYEPGIRFEILADALLYNTALQNTPAEAQHYLTEVQRMTRRVGAADVVEIHDYAELLSLEARAFARRHAEYYGRFRRSPDELFSPEMRARLFCSLRASINTRRLGLTYDDHRRLFSVDRNSSHPSAALINRLADDALREQLSIKMAADSLNLPRLLWPNGVRVSCHKGKKHDRHVIGLRVFPSYYRSCRLLPYHGMPLISMNERRQRLRLEVLPEVSLRGRPELTRVVGLDGATYCYLDPPAAAINANLRQRPNSGTDAATVASSERALLRAA